MKNVLVIINESGGPDGSENRLYRELQPTSAAKLLNFMMDQAVSELFPVEGDYDLCLYTAVGGVDEALRERLGDSFRYLSHPAATAGELIGFLTETLVEYDRIAVLRSSAYGWEEEAMRSVFQRLDEFDGVVAVSHKGDMFLLAMEREEMAQLATLSHLNRETIDSHSDRSGLHWFYMPEQAVAEDLESLSRLRESLRPESGMARQIDASVLDATAYPDDPQAEHS